MNNENSHLIPNDKAIDLMLAGNFTFTAKSLKTGNHYSYKILKAAIPIENNPSWTIYILVGGNEDYRMLGNMWLSKEGIFTFKADNGYILLQKSYKAFCTILNITIFRQEHKLLQLWSSSKCARCGRELTTEESVTLGIGPECVKKNYEYIKSLNLQ